MQELEITKGLKNKNLGEICKTEKGKKPNNLGNKSESYSIPYINIKAFEKGIIDNFTDGKNCRFCSKEDVLIVWDGARSGLVGKGIEGAIGSTIAKIYSDPLLNQFLYYFLISKYDYINTNTKGVGIPHVDPNILWNIPILYPPKNIQKLIVSKLDELFSHLDVGFASLQRTKLLLNHYRQAVLKAAMEGELTKEWKEKHKDELELASILLERILEERRQKWEEEQLAKYQAKGKIPKDDSWKKKYKEPFQPINHRFIEIPKGWEWATVDQISVKVRYGTSEKSNKNDTGIPVLRMGNIVNGELSLEKLKYLPKSHHEFPELLLEEDDLVFNRTNSFELVGKTALYKGIPKECSFASYLIQVRLSKTIKPQLLAYYINSVYGRMWIKSVVVQQVGQANVNGTKLRALSIPIPSLVEQEIIVSDVEKQLSIIKNKMKSLKQDLRQINSLKQAILKHAFEGKLVTQEQTRELEEKIRKTKQITLNGWNKNE